MPNFRNMLTVSASYTRPADTTAYAANDAITDNTTAASATILTFANAARRPGLGGRIVRAMIVDSAYVATNLLCDLFLFTVSPAGNADNAALAVTDAELLNCFAVINMGASGQAFPGLPTAGAGGNQIIISAESNFGFKCAAGSTTVYGLLAARNAYVPVSGEIFTVILTVEQDAMLP